MTTQNYDINVNVKTNGADDTKKKISDLNQTIRDTAPAADSASEGLGDIDNALGNLDTSIPSVISNFGRIVGSMGAVAAGAVAVVAGFIAAAVALDDMSFKMANFADEQSEMAEKMGVSVERLRTLTLIAEENSGSVQGMVAVYDKLAKSLDKADENSKRAELAFAKLGLNVSEMTGNLERDAYTIVQRWTILGKTAEATAAASQLLGASFRDQIPSINAAGGAYSEYEERVKRFGAVVTPELIEQGGKQERAISDMKMAWEGLSISLSQWTAHMRLTITNWVTDLLKGMKDVVNQMNAVRQAANFVESIPQSERNAMLRQAQQDSDAAGDGSHGDINRRFKEMLAKRQQQEASDKAEAEDEVRRMQSRDRARVQAEADAKSKAVRDAHAPKERDTAAAAAEAEAKRIQKLYESSYQSMERSVDLTKQSTEYEKTLWETQKGRFSEFSDSQKQQLLNFAKQLDIRNDLERRADASLRAIAEQERAEQKVTEELKRQAEQQEKLTRASIGRISKAGATATNAVSFEANTRGMSAVDRETFGQVNSVMEETTRALAELNNESQNYAENVERIKEAELKAVEAIRAAGEAKKKAQQDWTKGADDAMTRYLDSVSNTAEMTNQIFTKAFKGMEDNLVGFFETGKLNFNSFISNILKDLLRMHVQMNIMKPMMEMMKGGGAGGMFGSIGSWLTSSIGGFFADGGRPPMNKVSVVGERGPELFIPDTSGTIVPNHALSGSSNTSITVNIGSVDSSDRVQELMRNLRPLIKSETREEISNQRRAGGMLYGR
jgi:lambda family phage tail tape measure protein